VAGGANDPSEARIAHRRAMVAMIREARALIRELR
jgi:hypothetical protein